MNTDSPTPTDYQRFTSQLAYYVNGTLDASECAWMDAYIAHHPSACQELQFIKLLQKTTKNTKSRVPEHERLARLLQDWNRHRLQQPQSTPPSSLWQRCKNWLGESIAIPTPLLVFLGIIIIAQAIFIGDWFTQRTSFSPVISNEVYRGGEKYSSKNANATVKVKFKSDALYSDALIWIQRAETTIHSGPSDDGEVWIFIPEKKSSGDVCQKLQESNLVIYCQ